MSDVVIHAEGLGKRYRLGAAAHGPFAYGSLRETLARGAHGLWRRLAARRRLAETERWLWALKDVSFEVRRGEVLGVIGRNGAGKSTLLKILSRITEPTEGFVDLDGRVGSLLEVGTGFHPELSGRENIFLNGAILGMKRREIRARFDEIVAFAELAKFIDTPVKYYSSGMYMRLAFSVAAHLEPEILLVDEVLAVGDAAFQKKCLGKMGEVARTGRTVLFVSHNMVAVESLCTQAILLEAGGLAHHGEPPQIIRTYLERPGVEVSLPLTQRNDRSGSGETRFTSLTIANEDPNLPIQTGSRVRFALGYEGNLPLRHARFLVGIYDMRNTGVYLLDSEAAGGIAELLPARGQVTCLTAPMNITQGRCFVNVALLKGGSMTDYVQYAAHFDVAESDFYGTGRLPPREWVVCVLGQSWAAQMPKR